MPEIDRSTKEKVDIQNEGCLSVPVLYMIILEGDVREVFEYKALDINGQCIRIQM